MTAMLTQTIQSLKEHWRKYAFLVLVFLAILVYAYRVVSRAAHFAELYGESILRLSPGNVHLPQSGFETTTTEKILHSSPLEGVLGRRSYNPPESKIIITSKDPTKTLDQVVNVSYKTWGFTLEPGIQASIVPLGFGLDCKLIYINRWSGIVGMEYMKLANIHAITPTLTLSYHLGTNYFKNTELILGYSPLGPLPAYLGVRINF